MKGNNVVQEKSFLFSIKIINLYKRLTYDKKEFVLSKQLLRSGTSIGANIEESLGGQSEKDFLSKLCIAYKEAREAKYWLKLLNATDYINDIETMELLKDVEEICKILAKIQLTIREKYEK